MDQMPLSELHRVLIPFQYGLWTALLETACQLMNHDQQSEGEILGRAFFEFYFHFRVVIDFQLKWVGGKRRGLSGRRGSVCIWWRCGEGKLGR